ncbi:MAG: glycosyltransferase family 4 protein [Pseudomonadota bacterium]
MSNDDFQSAGATVAMAHVFPSFDFGGQQSRFATLANGLGPGFRHYVIALDGALGGKSMLDDTVDAEVRAFAAEKSSIVSVSAVTGLRDLLREASPSILCTYNWGAMEAVIANRLFLGLPHIHFEDGFGPGENPSSQIGRRVWARRALLGRSTVVVPSRVLEKLALERWRLRPETVRRLSNGVDLARFATARRSRESEDVLIGSIGALRPEKNYGRLIAAVEAIDGPYASLEILGDGPERVMLEEIASSTASAARVHLRGATAQTEAAYARFDIFALSSDTEQAPISLMEAMAAGLPVVATDVGDVARMVSEENRAFITPLGDEQAYRDALQRLAGDEALRLRLGKANAEKARRDYAATKMIEAHRSIYLNALI